MNEKIKEFLFNLHDGKAMAAKDALAEIVKMKMEERRKHAEAEVENK